MIPGLKSIEEEMTPDGKTRIIFNIEDDKAQEFFDYLGIAKDDEAGFQKIIIEAIETYLKKVQP
jgi:hypothetical protein